VLRTQARDLSDKDGIDQLSKRSEANATITDIPCCVNVLEEYITEDPEPYIMC
jgi:hypothetical protein